MSLERKPLDGCGEKECPGCEARGLVPADGQDFDAPVGEHGAHKTCPLCEGDKYLYWGEEWILAWAMLGAELLKETES